MKLYTGKGDKGKTGILGKERISKDDARIEAYGTVDELNSIIGMLFPAVEEDLHTELEEIQSTLFEIGSELASIDPKNTITKEDILSVEALIDAASEETPDLKSFILPGGHIGASWFHLARTVCRRTERRVVTLSRNVDLNENVLVYLNRLSDLFFAWARLQNHRNDIPDVKWEARE